ncbi:hypothetical protein MF672_030720 [Actinomadura sp. ATCC 31491]|uniref:MFS transporter n=1 Tax=Actinomadura luzonensis TaxID=2805427 RepID=A0ABT0G1R8_9ACTN|nr:hypothetical protein [Actinomadura luzonensis]MCK2218130.1 hypothetical protein [Actinomadura luzonensis]
MGLAGDVYRPAASALVAETTPPHLRAKAFGLMHWAVNVGTAAAGVVAGLLVVLDVTTSLAFAVIVAVGIPRGHDAAAARSARNGYAIAARDRVLMAALAFLLLGLILYRPGLLRPAPGPGRRRASSLPVRAAHHRQRRHRGGLPAAVHLLAVAPAPAARPRRLHDRGGPRPGPDRRGHPALALRGHGRRPPPEGAHGTYQALYDWTTAIARFAGPAVGAVLFQAGMLWWACAATGVVCAVLAVTLMPAVARRSHATAQPL